jgi:coenzyme F420-reducing hydrogenase delta subunit
MSMKKFTPKLVCFSCKFGWGYLTGNGFSHELKNLIPVTCSGQVSASNIVDSFREGADGVIILGCPEGECHFQNGNYHARKRLLLLQKMLGDFGIEPGRLSIRMGIDPEGAQIPVIIEEMKAELIKLGPVSPKV